MVLNIILDYILDTYVSDTKYPFPIKTSITFFLISLLQKIPLHFILLFMKWHFSYFRGTIGYVFYVLIFSYGSFLLSGFYWWLLVLKCSYWVPVLSKYFWCAIHLSLWLFLHTPRISPGTLMLANSHCWQLMFPFKNIIWNIYELHCLFYPLSFIYYSYWGFF